MIDMELGMGAEDALDAQKKPLKRSVCTTAGTRGRRNFVSRERSDGSSNILQCNISSGSSSFSSF